ncbi:MAG: FAD-dependent monooxygenase [Gammaproteobacteria bacterium]|nr:MAG: FAD-dependent monooxygenase [Gammaproteobacteria bacterium]
MSSGADKQVHPVVIVGAGPVGLVAALSLAARGVPSVVLERETRAPTDLRASTFHPPTLDLLEALDLTAPILAGGLRVPEWQVRQHETHERAVFDLSVLARDTRHPYRVQFEQADFCALLLRRAGDCDAIDLRRGQVVEQIEQQADRVTLDVAMNGDRQRLQARWVIAADGASSTLREALGLNFAGLTYPETTLLATTRFPFEDHLPGLSWVNHVWYAQGTFSLLRVPDRWRISLYPADGEIVAAALRPERLQSRLQEIVPNPGGYEIIEARPYRIHQRILDCYRAGRVLFAGDAAHLNSPSGGMGMNCGIHDAVNLAEKLAAVLAGGDESLLDLYDRQRRPIAREEILKQADGNRRRMQQRDPAWRRRELARLQAIAADRDAAREFLLRSSMISGLRKAAAMT